MSTIDKDLATLARREWPAGKHSASIASDGMSAYYYESPTAGKYRYADYLHARHALGLDDNVMTPEEAELPAKEYRRTAEFFLRQAAELMKERGKQYDQPGGERSMGRAIAALNAITGRDLTEAEGWLLMSLVKRVRQFSGSGYHQDSAEDAVAYAALEAEALESSALRARELEK